MDKMDRFIVSFLYIPCLQELYILRIGSICPIRWIYIPNTQGIYAQQIGYIAPVNRVITPFVEAFISRHPTYLCGMGKHSIRKYSAA